MVVAGILALALALPTGALFGIGYGTGVRIGYEQIYPLLFPAKEDGSRQPATAVANVKALNDIYNAIGGKEASQMGIAVGLSSAMSELDNNPDFLALLQLESSLSGSTSLSSEQRTRYGLDSSTSEERVQSEVDEFNERTASEKWTRYRTYTISQLNNIISSSTNQESIRIANAVLQEKLQSGGGPSTDVPPPPPPPEPEFVPPPLTTLSSAAKAWLVKRDAAIAKFMEWIRAHHRNPRGSGGNKNYYRNIASNYLSELRTMSNQYRDPDDFIREHAILLRQLLASDPLLQLPPYRT